MTLAVDRPTEPRVARFTKAEYLDMVDRGGMAGLRRHVFLFRGELIEMPPMGHPHAMGIQRTSAWAFRAFRKELAIRVQLPFDGPGDSLPEPDVCVLRESDSTRRPHPNVAELAIEIADTSRQIDVAKAQEYAVGVREYWLLDVTRRTLSVYRNPHADTAGLYGFAYDAPLSFGETDAVSPQCEPTPTVVVRDLLP